MSSDGRYHSLIQTYFSQGRYDLCRKFIEMEGPTDFSIEIQSKILRIEGKTKEALQLLSNHSKTSETFSNPETFLNIAKTLINVGKPKKALKILFKLNKSSQNNESILFNLALCHLKLDQNNNQQYNNSEIAEQYLKKVLSINSKHDQAYVALAELYGGERGKVRSQANLDRILGLLKVGNAKCPESYNLG